MADHEIAPDRRRSYSSKMAENSALPERRRSFTLKRTAKDGLCITCGAKTHQTSKSLLRRGRNMNPFASEKNSGDSAQCMSCQSRGNDLATKGMSISSHQPGAAETKMLRDMEMDVLQKSSQSLSISSAEKINIMSPAAHQFYNILKEKLHFAFDKQYVDPFSVSISEVICQMIRHKELNPVQKTFYEMLAKYPTGNTAGIRFIEDEDVAEVIVEAMKIFPGDVSMHHKTMDAISKLSGPNGVKIVSLATEFLQKFPSDQVVQLRFPPFLQKGIVILLKGMHADHRTEKTLPIKINRLTQVNYSNYDGLKQVLIDGIGCCLKETIIFRKACSILTEKRFDYVVDAYRSNIELPESVSEICSFITSFDEGGIDKLEKAGGYSMLQDMAGIYTAHSALELVILEAIEKCLSKRPHLTGISPAPTISSILRAMSQNISWEKLIMRAYDVLRRLGVQNAHEDSDVVKTIGMTIKEHPKNIELKEIAFDLLGDIKSPDNTGAVMFILQENLKYGKYNTRIIVAALSAFAKITREQEQIEVFIQHVAVNDVLAAQWLYGEDLKTQEQCCIILSNLLKFNKIERNQAEKIIKSVLEVLRKFPNDSPTQEAAFVTLSILSTKFKEEVILCDIVGLVVMGMITHTDIPKIQEAGCKILADVSSSTDIYQFGGIECILIAMAKHSDRKHVQRAACAALSVLYEQRNQEALENLSLIQPMLEASRVTFPQECKDVVNEIMKVIESQKPSTESGKSLTDEFAESIGGITAEDIMLAPPHMLSQQETLNYANKIIFVGAEESIREQTISQLVSNDESLCYRLRNKRDNLGLMDYAWLPYHNNVHSTKSDMMLNILDFSHNVPPGLFFSRQATYVLLWDISKTFQLDTVMPNPDEADDSSPIDAIMEDLVCDEHDMNKGIYENVIFWIDLIHKLMPNSQIYCLGVSKASSFDLEADRNKCHMVRMRFEEVNFERMTKGGRVSRANVAFEVGGDSIIYCGGKDSHVLAGLRNRILISTENLQEADVFMFDPVAELGTKQVIQAVKQMGRREIMMRWRQLLCSVKDKIEGEDSAMDVALHILLASGDIRTFQVFLTEGMSEEVVLLNNEWLVETVRCIVQNRYEDLKLSIEETKYDLCMHDWEEHEFCKICVHCPVISSEDSELLWQTTESVVCENKNTALAVSCLEQILTRMEILVPLRLKNNDSMSNIFFIPSLLEAGEPPGWSFKSSNSKMSIMCSAWAIQDVLKRDLMTEMITEILRDLHSKIERSKFEREMDPSKPTWCFPSEERNYDDGVRFIVHEICCWKTSILMKVEIEEIDPDFGKVTRGMIEILAHLDGRESPLCVASNSLRKREQRLSVTYKGLTKYARGPGTMIYDLFLLSTERVLGSHTDLLQRREVVCPDCLQNYPLAEASALDWSDISRCKHFTTTCRRGHRIGVSMYN